MMRNHFNTITMMKVSLQMKAMITVVLIISFGAIIAVYNNEFTLKREYISGHKNYSVQYEDEATRKFMNSLNCSFDEYVAKYLLKEPSKKPYNISKPTYMYNHASHSLSWKIIHKYLRSFFEDQESGFFIEAGALDGLLLSNTLWLEMEKKWTGLLVEPITSNYQSLLKKNRKVWSANACLSTVPYPKISNFRNARLAQPLFTSGKDHDLLPRGHSFNMDVEDNVEQEFSSPYYHHDYSTAICLPMHYFLDALNVTVVDFFSLDIEGGELQVLKLFPWEKVQLRTLVVEYKDKSRRNELISYMSQKGLTLIGESGYMDFFFVLNSEAKLLQTFIKII